MVRHPFPGVAASQLTSSTNRAPGGFLRWTGISLAFLTIGVPALYVSYCETVRHAELRRRRARFELRRNARRAKRVEQAEERTSTGGPRADQAEGGTADGVDELLTEEEKQDLRDLYASVRIGGRYSNPFPEWREQVWPF